MKINDLAAFIQGIDYHAEATNLSLKPLLIAFMMSKLDFSAQIHQFVLHFWCQSQYNESFTRLK